jgi:CheY-like chemotaxis protein
VAEGVETPPQHAELAALGCGFGQGYLYARPLGLAAFERLLQTTSEASPPAVGGADAVRALLGDSTPACAHDARAAGEGAATAVLVVDDEAPVRRAVRRMLEWAGYRVLEATDGADALRRLASETVDVVLTDVVMPELGGRALADALAGRVPAVRVVFMSGLAPDDLVRRGVCAPSAPVLQKPFASEELVHAVNAAATSRRASYSAS